MPGCGLVQLQTCFDDGLSAVQKQDQGVVSSFDATNTKTNDTTTNESNTEVMLKNQSLGPSICFISPLDLKSQAANNIFCKECVEKALAKTKEGLYMIVPPEYYKQINIFLDVNQ
eukprot:15329551-Ditylum_brightwellii.AAC.1